eukprot:2271140-Prymnesium_polylepis.1
MTIGSRHHELGQGRRKEGARDENGARTAPPNKHVPYLRGHAAASGQLVSLARRRPVAVAMRTRLILP